ncbi:MAG: hypothetical protein ACI3VA_07690 [Candidatus Limivicinus sp.]
MNRREIRRAYDSVAPDSAARERMLDNILSAVSPEQPGRKSKVLRRALCLAAVIALLLALGITAYAAGWFGLRDAVIGRFVVNNGIDKDYYTQFISLQGYSDSPEFKALCEWQSFLENYDSDGSILSSIGNSSTDFDEKYRYYSCYTQEMADEIDRICEKYSLSMITGAEFFESEEDFFEAAGVGRVCTRQGEGHENDFSPGYVHNDGSFHFEGQATFTGDGAAWPYPILYQFDRSMKGSFSSTVLNIGDAADYEEWVYTTKNGVELTLAQSDWKELILVERENSFVVVNLFDVSVGDAVGGELHKSREDLEAFAELFDFSVIS